MSPLSFSMLSGAGVVKGSDGANGTAEQKIYVHTNYEMVAQGSNGTVYVELTDEDRNGADIVVTKEAPVYPVTLDSAGAQANYLSAVTETQVLVGAAGDYASATAATFTDDGIVDGADGQSIYFTLATEDPGDDRLDDNATYEPLGVEVGDTVRIDCYEVHTSDATELQIDAKTFAGYYYIEASTLFRDEATGEDMPAEFVIPRGKIQSNFTFTMANSGDPSTSNVGVAA